MCKYFLIINVKSFNEFPFLIGTFVQITINFSSQENIKIFWR